MSSECWVHLTHEHGIAEQKHCAIEAQCKARCTAAVACQKVVVGGLAAQVGFVVDWIHNLSVPEVANNR